MLYSLQSFLKYFALLGLVPFSESCASRQHIQKVYSGLLVALNVAIFGISIIFFENEELFLSILINMIGFASKIMCATVIVLQIMLQYDEYFVFCRDIKSLGIRLQCELQIRIGSLSQRSCVKIIGLAVGFLVPLLAVVYVSLSLSLVYFWSSLLSILVTRVQCLLVLLYVELLGHHVGLLGERVQNVLACHLMGANCILDGNCNQLCSLEFLLALKQSHMELYYLFTHFNALFGWTMLSIYVVLFLDSTLNIYWTQQVLADEYEYTYLYATFAVFVPSLVMIIALCRGGEFCRRQNALIGSYLRSLACSPSPLQEPAYIELLYEFITQVGENSLAINAEGFMDIDNSLLMSILAAKVTYLIVLIQFSSL
ncbi:putative gustatory receptor 39b [Drosophila ficusphila]|uniref:putative gustatory receptor 39b n=1 Tax=Drosophila ficusphila TaxID=30025 RepID=UPI0007E89323|nr:putative gustatory receptor 39b [Drosophila ficusphila]